MGYPVSCHRISLPDASGSDPGSHHKTAFPLSWLPLGASLLQFYAGINIPHGSIYLPLPFSSQNKAERLCMISLDSWSSLRHHFKLTRINCHFLFVFPRMLLSGLLLQFPVKSSHFFCRSSSCFSRFLLIYRTRQRLRPKLPCRG